MIICCYTRIDDQWTEQELRDKLALLPQQLQAETLRKKQWTDRQLSIAGKLLVAEVISRLGYDGLSLDDIRSNTFHRPYFDAAVDFNIAHSGKLVICCGTKKGQVGVDIEKIKEIDMSGYTNHFTPKEWKKIDNQTESFYDLWTRKEAVLKAIGTGFYTPLPDIDVCDNRVEFDEVKYYLHKLNVEPGYSCHIASTTEHSQIDSLSINL
jgi:4'-phosphopantetheinyl transferase